MSKYTLVDDPAADSVIDDELNFVVAGILNVFGDHVSAILLAGGFGRGEGSVVREEGCYRPLNDYDIVVVVNRWKSIPQAVRDRLPQLEAELNSGVSVKQVDLAFIDAWKLMLPVPTIARYEIKTGHRILFGHRPVTIRSVPRRWLPLHEGTTYFRTRAGGLLIARLLLDHPCFPEKKTLELASLEIDKARLALGDAFLIENRSYHHSYAERRRIMSANRTQFSVPTEIADLYLNTIERRLRATTVLPSWNDTDQQCAQVSRLLIDQFLRFEGRRLHCRFETLERYVAYTSRRVQPRILTLGKLRHIYNKEDSPPLVTQRHIVMMLLESRLSSQNGLSSEVAARVGVAHYSTMTWNEAVLKYLMDWHSSGIVAELAKRRGRDREN